MDWETDSVIHSTNMDSLPYARRWAPQQGSVGMKKGMISAFLRFHSDGGNGYGRSAKIQRKKRLTIQQGRHYKQSGYSNVEGELSKSWGRVNIPGKATWGRKRLAHSQKGGMIPEEAQWEEKTQVTQSIAHLEKDFCSWPKSNGKFLKGLKSHDMITNVCFKHSHCKSKFKNLANGYCGDQSVTKSEDKLKEYYTYGSV